MAAHSKPRIANKKTVRRAKAKTTKPITAHKRSAPASKLDAVVAALRAPKGATITQLMTLTGWQIHSVRGAIAGALKKKRGLAVTSTKHHGERVYRIERDA